jgi:hypothetical protein
MGINVPRFLSRFLLSYHREDTCIEYFIKNTDSSETLSQALILSYNASMRDLHVSRFHPELFRQTNSKYMSAACFYLLIHHCAVTYFLDNACHISLETTPDIYDAFYGRLKDFNFHIHKHGLGKVVELMSDFRPLGVDVSMIRPCIADGNDIPFLCA